MSLRPRFGDGGTLRRPAALLPTWAGEHGWSEVTGTLSASRDHDPFERTEAGLLLAEDLARASLELYEDAEAWFAGRGVLDLRRYFPDEGWAPRDDIDPDVGFADAHVLVLGQQVVVAWVLRTLARLSDAGAWDPDWMSLVIDDRVRPVWIDIVRGRVVLRRRHAEPEPPEERALWVPARQRTHGWTALAEGRAWTIDDEVLPPLTPDRSGLIEVVRRILEPYVRVAGQFEVEMPWLGPGLPLAVRERRRWRSILAPVALQLLEGLRRVTEDQRGAAFCRECGEPFLSLDARRSSFCNDQHRFRFSQRERRRRLEAERAVRDAMAQRDVAAAERSGRP